MIWEIIRVLIMIYRHSFCFNYPNSKLKRQLANILDIEKLG